MDRLSQRELIQLEWKLNKEIFHQIRLRFGKTEVNLFATERNCRVPKFMARTRTLQAIGVSVLNCKWPNQLLYASATSEA